ncbi:hypothetical protein [Klebsiella variicola]|uniref:hypothetical protein n=1 Tax=Klebsiella variicola TaxID=244366 RepID=UPI003B7E3627
MNIETVNELILSLESAGELSIREQKFLKLAKAYQQLAAENVALKAEQVRIFNSGYLRGHESTVEGYYVDIHQDDITTYHEDVVAEISEEQTPSTDRIVAGIKADGVEMFVEKCREKSMRAISSDIRNNWWLAGEHAEDFAAQLREGADK